MALDPLTLALWTLGTLGLDTWALDPLAVGHLFLVNSTHSP